MEIGTIIIGAICIGLCLLPFYLTGQHRRKRQKRLLSLANQFAQANNTTVGEHEFGPSFLIGLDTKKEKLFFCKKTADDINANCIDLQKVAYAKSNIIKRDTGYGDNRKVVDRLQLELTEHSSLQPAIVFDFFNAEDNIQLGDELKQLDYWCKKINALKSAKQRVPGTF